MTHFYSRISIIEFENMMYKFFLNIRIHKAFSVISQEFFLLHAISFFFAYAISNNINNFALNIDPFYFFRKLKLI